MAQIKYVDYEALSYYDSRIKAFLTTADAEVLARAGVTIEIAETPTEGSAVTYIIYQDYKYANAEGNVITIDEYKALTVEEQAAYTKKATEIGKIEIPLDKVVDGGSLVVTEATEKDPAKAEIVLTIANTTDETTVSGKEEIRVDISAVAGDIAELVAKVEKLEATHDIKTVEVEGKEVTVFKTVEEEIIEKGANAIYVAEDTEAGIAQETVGKALTRMEDDLTYKGTVAKLPTDAKKGDLYNIVPAEGAAEDAPKGWKFYDGVKWQSLDDPTLTARVEALEATHATKQDEEGNEVFQTIVEEVIANAKDGVYVTNTETSVTETIGKALARIDGDVNTEGSILKKIYDTAANGYYDEILVADEEGRNPGDEGYVETKAKRSIREKIEAVAGAAKINVARLETPTESYASSYMITQNGKQVGELIDIPKDFLVKAARLVHYVQDEETGSIYEIVSDPEKTTPVEKPEQCELNKDYMDFTINTKEELPAEESHLYIDVTHLCEVYTGVEVENGISVKINATNEVSAEVSGKAVARENITDEFEANLKAIEDAIGYVDPEADLKELYRVAERINKEAKDGIYKEALTIGGVFNASLTWFVFNKKSGDTFEVGDPCCDDIGNPIGVVVEENGEYYPSERPDSKVSINICDIDKTIGSSVTIAEAIAALEESSKDTNGAFVFKGEVANKAALPADAKKGDAYKITDEKATYLKTDDAWVRIANEGEFKVGNEDLAHVVDLKTYIDSRIFIGTQEEVNAAKEAGTIDDTTLVIVTDEDASELIAITESEIDALFDPVTP